MNTTKTKSANLSGIVSPLLQWYDRHARILPWRENPEPYPVWISEIMLQQTRVEAVKPYFDRWMKAYPNLRSLANASETEVLKLWEGLGYYSRVRNIHKTAKTVIEKYGGSLPASFKELRTLPGIGEYTAGAIGSIAFQLPVPCVDGNVLRVVARITAEKADIGTAAAKKLITGWINEIIPKDRPGDFNQAMMELGATVCLPNGQPKCEACPLAYLCQARIQERISEFPLKSSKPVRRIEEKTVLVLLAQDAILPGSVSTKKSKLKCKVALRQRPDSGLLAGLWEFPVFDGSLSEDDIRRFLADSCLNVQSLVTLKKAKHIFTHIEWDMTGYMAVAELSGSAGASAEDSVQYCAQPSFRTRPDFQWFEIEQLDEQLALPAAFKHYYQGMKHYLDKESQNENNQE